jgi:hypothetical protein
VWFCPTFCTILIAFVIRHLDEGRMSDRNILVKNNKYVIGHYNVMHFLLNLLRIKFLYMFRALLAHLQEALNKQHLVYCVRVMSVGCTNLIYIFNCNWVDTRWQ